MRLNNLAGAYIHPSFPVENQLRLVVQYLVGLFDRGSAHIDLSIVSNPSLNTANYDNAITNIK